MTVATAVAAVATRNRPGSARISMSFGNSRLSSVLIVLASSRNGRTCRRTGPGSRRRCRGFSPAGSRGLRLSKIVRGQLQGLHVVLKLVHWLPTWKLSPSTVEPASNAARSDRPPRRGDAPNFYDSSTTTPVLGTRIRRISPACGACFFDLVDLGVVVVGDERLVLVELLERGDVLDRVGVDDLVPDEVLPLFGRQVA